MSTLQKSIASKFLATLARGKEVDSEKIEKLRKLLEEAKKPKADDFIKILAAPAGGDVA
jgi:preprotein translocase subunit Sss1